MKFHEVFSAIDKESVNRVRAWVHCKDGNRLIREGTTDEMLSAFYDCEVETPVKINTIIDIDWTEREVSSKIWLHIYLV